MATDSKELLRVTTEYVDVIIKGPLAHPALPGVSFQGKTSHCLVQCADKYELKVYDGSADSDSFSFLTNGEKTQPLFFEQQRYELIIQPKDEHTAAFFHDNINLRRQITPVGDTNLLSGIINFGSDIGFSDLIIRIDGQEYLTITIEVYPSKIDYQKDYEEIIADITSEVYNLIFDFLKKTYAHAEIASSQRTTPVEFYAILQNIFKAFIASADLILRNPHHQLYKEHEVLPQHKVKQYDGSTIRWLQKHPEHLMRKGDSIKVAKALSVRKYVTYDTKENRLVKYILEQTSYRLMRFKVQYCSLQREPDEEQLKQIDRMLSAINRRCNTGFMAEVTAAPSNSGMSLVFGMASGYRDLFRHFLQLQHGLTATGSLLHVSLKDLSVLYENWCFIKLVQLLRDKYQLDTSDVVQVTDEGLFLGLLKGEKSTVEFKKKDSDERITLTYNRAYNRTHEALEDDSTYPTVSQKPDNILSLRKTGSDIDYRFVFDAKYKINSAAEGTSYKKIYKTPGPQEEDINTMHRYRDAIVSRDFDSSFRRTLFGAYVLFPYHDEEQYKNHKFYKSINKVNVGGLPFLPSATGMVEKLLDELISDNATDSFGRALLPVGMEDHWLKKPDLTQLGVFLEQSRTMPDLPFRSDVERILLDELKQIAIDNNPQHLNKKTIELKDNQIIVRQDDIMVTTLDINAFTAENVVVLRSLMQRNE